jgi:hypothetical protein
MNWSLHTMPVELVYRILDHLDDVTILLACRNVCTKLNAITDTYYRYKVIFFLYDNEIINLLMCITEEKNICSPSAFMEQFFLAYFHRFINFYNIFLYYFHFYLISNRYSKHFTSEGTKSVPKQHNVSSIL